jgi:hypothetical protein
VTNLQGECARRVIEKKHSTEIGARLTFRVNVSDGSLRQALDRDQSTTYLNSNCSYRHAEEE